MRKLSLLLELAKLGAHSKPHKVTSGELGDRFGCSQQTAARWLNKLSEEGLIEQNVGSRGQTVMITPKGNNLLKSTWQNLDQIYGKPLETIELSGQIVSGIGEGSYYVGQEKYRKQFRENLRFDPYQGTLDLRLDEESLRLKERLRVSRGKEVKGFTTQERSFGGAKCFHAEIRNVEAGVVLPNRTHHEDVIEILAPVKLRDKFGLKDGDVISVEVEI